MNIEQAKEIIKKAQGYVAPEGKRICLDGWFTIAQLEAVYIYYKHLLETGDGFERP